MQHRAGKSGATKLAWHSSINDPANSLVFGYIDMDDAPTSVSYAWQVQVAPPSETPYWGLRVNKGLFYNVHLPHGSYQLSKLGGSGFFAGEHGYSFPRQGNRTALHITKPGINFLGSFKYKTAKTGFFEVPKVAIVDDYDRANAVFKKKFGSKIALRKALLTQAK